VAQNNIMYVAQNNIMYVAQNNIMYVAQNNIMYVAQNNIISYLFVNNTLKYLRFCSLERSKISE
jgi:hypothetical protein